MPEKLEHIDAAPFVAWIKDQLERLEGQEAISNPDRYLAERLQVDPRYLWRWKSQLSSQDTPTDTFVRRSVENALANADVPIWEIYPDLYEDPTMEDAYCSRCHEIVTVGPDAVCPWCETPTESEAPRERRWCENCDRSVFPANNGSCWRCSKPTKEIPWESCECDCGRMVKRFDAYGRGPQRFVQGHGRLSQYQDKRSGRLLDPEPFAQVIEEVLENLDPIAAVARELGIGRDTVLYVLNRRGPIEAKKINRALWFMRRGGKGSTRKVYGDFEIPTFRDLYQEFTCPDCGGRKGNPAAELCKKCRLAKNKREGTNRPPTAQRKLREDQIEKARAFYYSHGRLNMLATAAWLLPETPYASADSLSFSLANVFRERGWPVGRAAKAQAAESVSASKTE